ncbi:MAG: cytochrome c oxidase subunit II [Acuticoccus sp.]
MCAALTMAAPAAAEVMGQPHPWGVSLQLGATEIMNQIRWFETYTLIIITVIVLFVMALMGWVMVRYRAHRNPNPSRVTHNTMVEIVWTIVPVLILVAIAFPSFRLLFAETTIPEPQMTVKFTGGQWYWQYDYMDEDFAPIGTIISNMLNDEGRQARMEEYNLPESSVPRLLSVDYPLVVPEDTVIHVLTTSLDVNHAMAVPAFGIKADSIKGRINESWFSANETGIFYGQCSELCGRNHAFMPMEVHVLDKERFAEWTALAKDDLDKATEQLFAWQAEDTGSNTVAALAN